MATVLVMALKEESQGLFEKMQIFPAYCGIGQVHAAYFTHKLILEQKAKRIINLGTAGSHTLPQGTLVECTSFIQRPANDFLPLTSKIINAEPITDLPKAVCGTADFINLSTPLVNCDVMDMEAYAMAYICQKLQIPFTSIKYVSDSSDSKTASSWKQSLALSAQKLLEQYQKIAAKDNQ